MFDRTVQSRIDALTFSNINGKCWANYRGWSFRIEGANEKHCYFINHKGNPIKWNRMDVGSRDRPYTLNYQGRLSKVIRKCMGYIDEEMQEEVQWPECC